MSWILSFAFFILYCSVTESQHSNRLKLFHGKQVRLAQMNFKDLNFKIVIKLGSKALCMPVHRIIIYYLNYWIFLYSYFTVEPEGTQWKYLLQCALSGKWMNIYVYISIRHDCPYWVLPLFVLVKEGCDESAAPSASWNCNFGMQKTHMFGANSPWFLLIFMVRNISSRF